MNKHEETLYDHLAFIYGKDKAGSIFDRIKKRLDDFEKQYPDLVHSLPSDRVNEDDSILITYGDMVYAEGEQPLKTLASFLQKYLGEVISTVHILPFYPYSSDDGFSIIDYFQVNPDFGGWEDVEYLGKNFRLMFDAVVNHVSSQSVWFQGFLKDDPAYRKYFTVVEPGTDLSRVFRPRAAPVLTPFSTPSGEKLVWTTFSADQIDLNFANPDVLLEVIDILLFFAANGAEFIRLDAVTFVWKEIGTTCVNSAHTHRIVQTIRTVFDLAAPKVAVITETNVPHKDNIAYFGDGTNEAQMVYNFALPILTINAFHQQDAATLSAWASNLDLPSDQTTFFNFLACHDGIGLLPVKDILNAADIETVADRTRQLGGFVSYKSNEDGSQSPYELNINYLELLGAPQEAGCDVETEAQRFLATQAIMLALRGVPGIYFHSLFGSRNWGQGVEKTGRHRTINREKFPVEQLERELADPQSLRHHVYHGYHHLLETRKANPAFHPSGGQEILNLDKSIFALIRTSINQDSHTLCFTNVTSKNINIDLDLSSLPFSNISTLIDTLSGNLCHVSQGQLKVNHHPIPGSLAAKTMNFERLLTESLRASDQGKPIAHILAAALESVHPGAAVKHHMEMHASSLAVNGSKYDLGNFDHIWVIGFGKASIPMAEAALKILGKNLTGGIVITKSIPLQTCLPQSNFKIFKSGHPLPDESSLSGAQSVIDLLAAAAEKDLVIFLISGGGSALLTLPVKDITLDDIQALTTSLLSCGATINEFNTLRKHLSKVKGGLLAQWAAPAQVVTLILSDVVGDPLEVIASGPTVPDPSTFSDALGILEKYKISALVPTSVRGHLEKGARGDIPETPKAGSPIFDKVKNLIVGNNYQAARAAAILAEDTGFNTFVLTTFLQGEARQAGMMFAAIARQIDASGDPVPRPACVIAGGETTVTLLGSGSGGRNQELALSAVTDLAGIKNAFLITLATDGDDGPTDAAGAVVSGDTLHKAGALGLHPEDFLRVNNSYHFFEPLGDLLKPGPTGTNVCDLTFLFLL